MPTHTWSDIGRVSPRELKEARLAAHYAAQPLAAAAYALLPMREDHSHTNLLWSAEHGLFLGRDLPSGARVFLDVGRLRTGLLATSGATVTLELAGRTLADAFDGMAELLREVGEDVPGKGLELPSYDLPVAPVAPVADGARFEAPREALQELERWFANGWRTVQELSSTALGSAEVRGWPHHFDVAALLTLDPEKDAEDARSLNVGLSPGDGSYDEPYFYASPWPYPASDTLPELEGGARWHTDGFTAAVLTGSAIVSEPRADPTATLRSVVKSALALLR